jgi:hypothetical protein
MKVMAAIAQLAELILDQRIEILARKTGGIFATYQALAHQDTQTKLTVYGVAQHFSCRGFGDVPAIQAKEQEQAAFLFTVATVILMEMRGHACQTAVQQI